MTWSAFGGSRPSGHDGASSGGSVPGHGGAPGQHPASEYGDAYRHPGAYGDARGHGPQAPGPYGPQPGASDAHGRGDSGHDESGYRPVPGRIGHHPGHPRPIGESSDPAAPTRTASRDAARAGRHPGSPADGTYVPEGGASPTGVGGLREWPALVVLALLAASLVVAAVSGFRPGTLMIGGTFAVAAILRLFVRDVGILAVRSRFTDVMVMLMFGGTVVVLGLMVPPPLIDLPWVPKRTG
ncbi:DUF3017 domain-containing protein [Yinghuangia sp. YIM S10712]|uniref:DUF3017 domain-containing protein n=1 Tax=Yinghuangia sp. YIM S10712 TaxID=3436930 RepID=UPI003F533689